MFKRLKVKIRKGKESVEIYPSGTRAYAITRYFIDGKESNYLMIAPVIIVDAMISKSGIDYFVTTPSGEDWNGGIPSKDIDIDFYKLAKKCKTIWKNDKEYC